MLTAEDVGAIYDQGREAVVALILEFQARIVALEEQRSKDSHNSHRPPSSDRPGGKPRPSKPRGQTGRRPGGQTGHAGKTLKMVSDPTTVVVHSPENCAACGEALGAGGRIVERRQVFDLPEVVLAVTEHRVLERTCSKCGAHSMGQFPAGVEPGAQYGSRVKSWLVYLSCEHMVPLARTVRILGDLCGTWVSQGTIENSKCECAGRVEPIREAIKAALRTQPVVGFDETGMKADKKLAWLHTAGTASMTAYDLDPKRGQEAMDRIGILPAFHGVAVHDAWDSYDHYACQHQLCNAHLLRELIAVHENTKQPWAAEMGDLLRTMHHKRKHRGSLTACQQRRFRKRYDELVWKGRRAHPISFSDWKANQGKKGPPKQTPAQNLLDRLQYRADDVLRFMTDPAIPFDNNQSERDLRMNKVKQKVSGCFRSQGSGQTFCLIRSYTQTMAKQGHNVLDALISVFDRKPLMPSLA